jgi:GYF domain 2/Putative peptidoglycan binding domain
MRKGVWEWYLKQDGKEYGPLSHRELLLVAGLGKVRSQDRVWAPGFPSWVPAALIPGLLKPSFTLSMLTLSRSWEPALRRCRASWLRAQERAASLLHGFSIRSAIKLPAVWLGVGSVLAGIIIGTSTQNSEPSFAIGAPALSKAETSACDPAAQLQAFNVTPILLGPDAPMHEEVRASVNDETPIPSPPAAPMHEEVEASENGEVAKATEPLPAYANSTEEDAIPLPTRKSVVEPPLRSIDTKEGARSVQRRLRDLGYLADDVDGSWGPKSRIALKQFQLRAKISRANGWDRRAERVLFSGNAPRALSTVPSPFAQAHF